MGRAFGWTIAVSIGLFAMILLIPAVRDARRMHRWDPKTISASNLRQIGLGLLA